MACSSQTAPRADGGPQLDATFLDASFDGSPWPDGSLADASADAAPLACMSGNCDPREPSTTCDGAEVCALVGGEPTCVPSTGVGTGLEGTTCTASADCAPGLACIRYGDGAECAAVCCPSDAATCGSDMRCSIVGGLAEGGSTDWWHCIGPRPCDVFNPSDKCEPEEGCYIVSAEGDTDCLLAGTGGVGESCAEQNDCAAGLFCGGLVERTCSRICGVSGDPTCPDGEGSCVVYAHSPVGTGICTVETSMMFR
jgi:hypothetical protein